MRVHTSETHKMHCENKKRANAPGRLQKRCSSVTKFFSIYGHQVHSVCCRANYVCYVKQIDVSSTAMSRCSNKLAWLHSEHRLQTLQQLTSLTTCCPIIWRRQHWLQIVIGNDVIVILCISSDCTRHRVTFVLSLWRTTDTISLK